MSSPLSFLRRRTACCLVLWPTLLVCPALAQAQLSVMLEESPPYSFTDARGQPDGYSVELVRELLLRAKLSASYEFTSWPRVLLRGRSEAAVLLPAIVRLPEREPQFYWLGQIASRRGTLFRLRSRPDVQVPNVAAAKAYLTGVIKDDVSERELVALGLEPGLHLDRSGDYQSLLRKFFAGRCDLVALNQGLAATILKQYGHDPRLIEPVLKYAESRPSMALSLATPEPMRQQLQQAWDSMRRDGSMAAIAARYPMIAFE